MTPFFQNKWNPILKVFTPEVNFIMKQGAVYSRIRVTRLERPALLLPLHKVLRASSSSSYMSWSWATCWPVPVSHIQKSLQRSAVIPSASWGIEHEALKLRAWENNSLLLSFCYTMATLIFSNYTGPQRFCPMRKNVCFWCIFGCWIQIYLKNFSITHTICIASDYVKAQAYICESLGACKR